jgi:hypothetical protein
MRLIVVALAILAASLGFAASGNAQKPGKSGQVTLKASADTITFSTPVTLTGAVKGAKGGVPVTLLRRATTATEFTPAATSTTDGQGKFSFTERPKANTVYRAMAATAVSPDVTELVRPLVGLKVSDSTPRKGQRVRFHGSVRPPHDGTRVAIQKRRADGSWVTVATPVLVDAGSTFSTYSKRLRIRRSGTYRTLFTADADHAEGTSRERTLTAH